jgi:protocatechuate 3,4-dioxygenase beta subunit
MTRILAAAVLAAGVMLVPSAPAAAKTCRPTSATHPNESRNPNYRPGAPVRASVGAGHVLTGVVRSSAGCHVIARARIEFFQIAANGRYSNGVTSWAGRATLFSRSDGSYRFESPFPPKYGGNRPHIHVYVTADGFRPLRTVYLPKPGETRGRFDFVLVEER